MSNPATEIQKKVLESIMNDMSDMMVSTTIDSCCDDGVNVSVNMHKKVEPEDVEEDLDDKFDAVLLEVE